MSDSTSPRPRVGLGVLVFKEGKILLGKRKGDLGDGFYAWPGGHLEYMESFEQCAKREVLEETGMDVTDVKFLRVWNFKTENKHYVDLAFTAQWLKGEPELREPDKCEGWEWYDMDKLPTPLFAPEFISLDALKTGRVFYDE